MEKGLYTLRLLGGFQVDRIGELLLPRDGKSLNDPANIGLSVWTGKPRNQKRSLMRETQARSNPKENAESPGRWTTTESPSSMSREFPCGTPA